MTADSSNTETVENNRTGVKQPPAHMYGRVVLLCLRLDIRAGSSCCFFLLSRCKIDLVTEAVPELCPKLDGTFLISLGAGVQHH